MLDVRIVRADGLLHAVQIRIDGIRRPVRIEGLARPALLELYRSASRDLGEILAATSPETPAWTWSEDQTVGFIRRRQAHEALIHRVDAELTVGRRTPMDPGLSADGVGEVIVATNPNLLGDGTANYLSLQLKGLPVRITRLARGLPIGSDLEYADEVTLTRALEGRAEYR